MQSLANLLTLHSLIQKPKKLKCPPKTTMTLLVSLVSYILATLHLHTSHTSHIFTIITLPHSIISLGNSENHLSSLRFIQPKINELFMRAQTHLCTQARTHGHGDTCIQTAHAGTDVCTYCTYSCTHTYILTCRQTCCISTDKNAWSLCINKIPFTVSAFFMCLCI